MKIVITGGGSGGHVYPLISVIDKIREISEDENLVQPKVYYMAVEKYDRDMLFKNDIEFVKISAGKLRKQFSPIMIWDFMKMGWGVFITFFKMLGIYPDVVFTNGGYVAFPVVLAARVLRIPIVIHVSDTVPSRVLLFAGKSAVKVSIAFEEAAKHFNKKKIAHLGNPIRDEIKFKQKDGAHEFFKLDSEIPTILVIGGSQGAVTINNAILGALPQLVEKYQIIHQTGKNNYNDVYGISGVTLMDNPNKNRYKVFPYLNNLQMKMAAGTANLAICRAGAGTINEIANWGIASIMIPISKEVSRDQESNSFAYARSGAAKVIRQKNLSPNILIHEINLIFEGQDKIREMERAALAFFKKDADLKIAHVLLEIGISHSK